MVVCFFQSELFLEREIVVEELHNSFVQPIQLRGDHVVAQEFLDFIVLPDFVLCQVSEARWNLRPVVTC